jgi:hypothetical protein
MITEPRVIIATGIAQAWKEAAQLLVDHGDRFNLTVHITDPTNLEENDMASGCHRRVCPSIRKSVYDVANTIFPQATKWHTGPLADFFGHYEKVYKRGLRRSPTAWGVYFLRLIAFGPAKKNPLGKMLDAMSGWKSRPRAAFVLHLSSAELDNPRSLGAPCWQYAQFIRSDDKTLSLVAVYRSHDYFEKALGNFLGLTRLLAFICHHTGMTPGTLTCLSTYATLQGKAAKMRQLLSLT